MPTSSQMNCRFHKRRERMGRIPCSSGSVASVLGRAHPIQMQNHDHIRHPPLLPPAARSGGETESLPGVLPRTEITSLRTNIELIWDHIPGTLVSSSTTGALVPLFQAARS